MLTVLSANGPSGYRIANSLRFRSSASAYLNRTQSAGSQTTWTFSAWVKLGALSGLEYLLNAGGSSGSGIVYNVVTNEFQLEIGNGTTQYYARTSASFRDPSAWYHLVAVADTTNATSSNRLRLYVNGVQQTIGTSSYPTQNFTGYINQNSIAANIGRWNGATPTYYFDGYMAEVNFIDGQALTPSSFGEFNPTTGVWTPKKYAGTYGTNGFHLDFKNGTSTTTLGYDNRDALQRVVIRESDGTQQTVYAGVGACAVSTISTSNSSMTSAVNEYLSVTFDAAIAITSSLKIYFDINATWANGRNLYLNGTSVNASNITVATVNGMQEWTINYVAQGIATLASLTTPQNTGGRALFYGVSVNGNTVYATANDWTTNNVSLTAGSTYDWMIDSPTPYQGASYGVGNYAVLNPLYAYSSLTLSGANLNIASSANYRSGMASFGMSSGKWYWEYVVTAVGNDTILGISSNPSVTIASYPGNDVLSWGYEAQVGNKYNNGSFSAYGATYTTNDVIGVAFDADAGSLTFYKNGVSQGVAYSSLANNTYYAAFGLGVSSTGSANFGQRPFAYTPPSGYKSLCTYNLPTPTIQNGAGHMAATLYTGNGTGQSITNAVNSVSFQPDFVWIKNRNNTQNHALYDSVRGVRDTLSSSLTNAENLEAAGYSLTAFNSNGYTLGLENAGYGGTNANTYTYVGWQWKAGGTAVTNTAGSITSSVSANTTSGFSVVTYTGTGSNATVGHGLGVAPSMIIVKNRSVVENWPVYHVSLTANGRILLNTTGAYAASSSQWNNTAPTSSVFTVNTDTGVNGSGNSLVAYCFAAIPGYSAFGSYTGNGSSDGPFVFLGFRPRFIMVKSSSVTSGSTDWWMFDTSRLGYNVHNANLSANTSAIEYDDLRLDILSNGFKLRVSYTNINQSGETYIYAAFAENPFKNSLAR